MSVDWSRRLQWLAMYMVCDVIRARVHVHGWGRDEVRKRPVFGVLSEGTQVPY